MVFQTAVRDCLFLNWAFRRELLPEPPAPLRYETHESEGRSFVFASGLLFRQQGLRTTTLPIRVSHPQLNLRLYVRDGDGVPSVLLKSMYVPAWVVPGARLTTGLRMEAARFSYPRPSSQAEEDGEVLKWHVRRAVDFRVSAEPGGRVVPGGFRLGSWDQLTEYFRQRDRGYFERRSGLRRVETTHGAVTVMPMRADVEESALLATALGIDASEWPVLHSAWLCPEMEFSFAIGMAPKSTVPRQVPAPG